MYRNTFAIIDREAIRHNVSAIRGLLGAGTRLLVAVKANGYGHGAVQTATAALQAGATDLGVATLEEGIALRDAGIAAPILVMGAVFPEAARIAALRRIAVTIGAPWQDMPGFDPPLRVHLKLDTGMSRLGARTAAQAVEWVSQLADRSDIRLEGAFTHLVAADARDLRAATAQMARFDEMLRDLAQAGIGPLVAHAANTAATLRQSAWHRDMVRVGIGAYGYGPAGVYESPVALRPAMSLYSCITRVETLATGETVGYGGTFTARRKTRIATVPIGYADGYLRALSNRASVLLRGERAQVVGSVCMDQLMIDVSDIPGVEAGDCVTLFGRSAPEEWRADEVEGWPADRQQAWLARSFRQHSTGRNGYDRSVLSLDELADLAGTISYELMCAVSARVPRIYV